MDGLVRPTLRKVRNEVAETCKCYVTAPSDPRLNYDVVYCPLHAAAPELFEALRVSAARAHKADGSCAPNFVKFEECKKAECVAAREAVRKAGGE